MTTRSRILISKSADETARIAQDIGTWLRPGDTLLLKGSIGAGKTHFARELIQSQMHISEDIPSPTFTLVQTYETPKGEIWHADLYRLSSAEEIEELGLSEAFESAICLVEWPGKLGDYLPANALTLTFEPLETGDSFRRITLSWSDPKWTPRLEGLA